MQTLHVPAAGVRYWAILAVASTFGANSGDFVSSYLRLGHAKGLLPLAILLGIILLAERRSRLRTEMFYWAAIIVIRTGATNLADLLNFDLHLGYPAILIGLTALLVDCCRDAGHGDWRLVFLRTQLGDGSGLYRAGLSPDRADPYRCPGDHPLAGCVLLVGGRRDPGRGNRLGRPPRQKSGTGPWPAAGDRSHGCRVLRRRPGMEAARSRSTPAMKGSAAIGNEERAARDQHHAAPVRR
jgi:hypothetical protein